MVKNINIILKNIFIILITLSIQIAFYSCSTSKNLVERPENIAPSKLYELPKKLDLAVLIPDQFATDTLKRYETEKWLKYPLVYKLKSIHSHTGNKFSIDTNSEKISTSFRNMKVVVPYYQLTYRYKKGGMFKDPGWVSYGTIYLDQNPNTIIVKHFRKSQSSPFSHEQALKELNFDKYKKCIFILAGEDEHQIDYGNKFTGVKLICINNDKERDEVIKALVALKVKY